MYRTECKVAGMLFIAATVTTMAAQIILEPLLVASEALAHIAEHRNVFIIGVRLELTNAFASGGIAIVL